MSCIWDNSWHCDMSHFWPFCVLNRPSLDHTHLCSVILTNGVLFSVFSERHEQPSAADLLCSAHRTASSQQHQHHCSRSVCEQKKKKKKGPNYNPFSHLLCSLKRYTAVDWEAVWSHWSTQTRFFCHASWPTTCRSQGVSTQAQGSTRCERIITFCLDYATGSLMKVFCIRVSTEEMSNVLKWFGHWNPEFLVETKLSIISAESRKFSSPDTLPDI